MSENQFLFFHFYKFFLGRRSHQNLLIFWTCIGYVNVKHTRAFPPPLQNLLSSGTHHTLILITRLELFTETLITTAGIYIFVPSGLKVPLSLSAPDRKCRIFGLAREQNRIHTMGANKECLIYMRSGTFFTITIYSLNSNKWNSLQISEYSLTITT